MRFGQFWRLWKDESGQAAVMVLLSMTLLTALLALSLDVGVLFHARRNVQLATDAAAVAAALDYKYNSSASTATTAAQNAATANGISNVATNVTVHIPPANGPYAGMNGFSEVIIKQPINTTLLNAFGMSSVSIAGRAVASSGPTDGCIWALGSSASTPGVTLESSGSLTATSCNIYDDSSATGALLLEGSGSVNAKSIGVVGTYLREGSGTSTPNPTHISTGAANPLNLTAPTIPSGGCTGSNAVCRRTSGTMNPGTYTSVNVSGSNSLTMDPGNYVITGGLSINSSGSVNLGAGFYIIEGGLTLTGSGSITGTGVTLYVTGPTTLSGSGSLNLTAPLSGTYSGVLLYQGDASTITIEGSGGANLQGIFYAPQSELDMEGSGNFNISTDLILNSILMEGSGSITNTNYAVATNTNSVLGKLGLVE